MINIIVAVDSCRGISKNGMLPWKNKEEMSFFREKTLNKTVLMGRKTALTLPNGFLKDRKNIILSKNNIDNNEHVHYCDNLEDALKIDDEIWVIGGLEIYKQCLPFSDKIYMSILKENYQCDKFFPYINMNVWDLENRYSIHSSFDIREYNRR